jgi:hypothetical protein
MKQHFLISLKLNNAAQLHGYLMTTDEADTLMVQNVMLDFATEQHLLGLPVILQTTLGDGADIVRDIICKHDEGIKKMIQEARDYHFTMFAMPDDNPDNVTLLALH